MMTQTTGQIIEVQVDFYGNTSAWITCPEKAIPAAGQYLMAWSQSDVDAPLATAVFPAGLDHNRWLAAAPLPPSWRPGDLLALRGPLGRGFSLPNDARRLVLAAFETGLSRLLPLAKQAVQQECAVTVFADPPLPDLPPAIEVYPLEDLPEALAWADLMALDLRREFLPRLRDALDIRRGASLACPIEALIWTPMPCGGLGRCGACHITAPGGWKLACEDGPVFDIQHLDW